MKYEENVATRKSTVRGTVNEPTYGIVYTLCSKKTCDHVFDGKLKQNCEFTKILAHLLLRL